MRIISTCQNIDFEWESEKAMRNLDKHGMSFETACDVFFDPFVMIVEVQEVEGELRTVMIGMTPQWNVLYRRSYK